MRCIFFRLNLYEKHIYFITCGMSDGLKLDQYVSINGSPDLRDCIKGEDGAEVSSIYMEKKGGGTYNLDYRLTVTGKGPNGGFFDLTSMFTLYFTDGTGDTYSLNLYKSGIGDHVVDFSSEDPRITNIAWN